MHDLKQFQKQVLNFYKKNKRDLPWRRKVTPYTTLVSEVMLQQTQVPRVIEKYKAWMKAFPSIRKLAQASTKEVLQQWQGLGYNRRGLNLHRTAQIIVKEYKGKLPDSPEVLVTLPGIGPATAASICAFGFNKPTVFIETNVRTVFIHHFFKNKTEVHDNKILPLVKDSLPKKRAAEWYSALMDYGTELKKLYPNPSRKSKHYTKQSTFKGSDRQLRGKILRRLLKKSLTEKELVQNLKEPKHRVEKILNDLKEEKFITKKRTRYAVV